MALIGTKDIEGEFNKLVKNLPKVKENFTMRLLKSNEWNEKWELIIDFIQTRIDNVSEEYTLEDWNVATMRSVWMSYRLIDEETKWLYMKYHVKDLFPQIFRTLEKLVVNKN